MRNSRLWPPWTGAGVCWGGGDGEGATGMGAERGGRVLGKDSGLPVQRTLIYKISFSYGVCSKPRYLHRITLMEWALRTATFPYYRNELSLKD